MILIFCLVVLMLICLAGFVFGIYLLYKAIKYGSLRETDALVVVGHYIGGIVFSVAGLVGFISEIVFLLSLLQKP